VDGFQADPGPARSVEKEQIAKRSAQPTDDSNRKGKGLEKALGLFSAQAKTMNRSLGSLGFTEHPKNHNGGKWHQRRHQSQWDQFV
jgi:hypothetical protein